MADVWQELARHGCRRLVLLAPHPDDEVFGLGGIMALATRRGLDVTVLAVTDGEASHPQSLAITPQALVERRHREVLRAYAALGINPHRIRLGLPDADVSERQLHTLLPSFLDDATVVFAPLPNDGHPDHDACGRAVSTVAAHQGVPCFTYPIWAHHRRHDRAQDLGRRWHVHLPRATVRAKRRAMDCFVSQFAPLGSAPADGPVLSAGFREPFQRSFEVVYG